jgi:hypothetical protein
VVARNSERTGGGVLQPITRITKKESVKPPQPSSAFNLPSIKNQNSRADCKSQRRIEPGGSENRRIPSPDDSFLKIGLRNPRGESFKPIFLVGRRHCGSAAPGATFKAGLLRRSTKSIPKVPGGDAEDTEHEMTHDLGRAPNSDHSPAEVIFK